MERPLWFGCIVLCPWDSTWFTRTVCGHWIANTVYLWVRAKEKGLHDRKWTCENHLALGAQALPTRRSLRNSQHETGTFFVKAHFVVCALRNSGGWQVALVQAQFCWRILQRILRHLTFWFLQQHLVYLSIHSQVLMYFRDSFKGFTDCLRKNCCSELLVPSHWRKHAHLSVHCAFATSINGPKLITDQLHILPQQ